MIESLPAVSPVAFAQIGFFCASDKGQFLTCAGQILESKDYLTASCLAVHCLVGQS